MDFYENNNQFLSMAFSPFEQWISCPYLFYSSTEEMPPIKKIIPSSHRHVHYEVLKPQYLWLIKRLSDIASGRGSHDDANDLWNLSS